MNTLIDLTGQRFGRILVLRRGPNANYKPHVRWYVRCDCGKESLVDGRNLRLTHTKSCGCLARERMAWSDRFMAAVPRLTPEEKRLSALRYLWQDQKHRAKDRKLRWTIPPDLYIKLCQKPCVYCGAPPSNCRTILEMKILHSGLDRIDSARGYVAGNVAPCCFRCNAAKNVQSVADFIAWAKRLVEHQNSLTA